MKGLNLFITALTILFLSNTSFAGANKLPILSCEFNNKNIVYKTRVDLNAHTIRFNQSPENVKGNEYSYHYLNAYTLAFGEKGLKNFSNNTDNNSYIIHNDIAHNSAYLYIISMDKSDVIRIKGSCSY